MELATAIIKGLAVIGIGYIACFVVRIEKCLSTIKAQLEAVKDTCHSRREWITKNEETVSKNHTNIRIIAAHSGLGEELEQ